MQKTTSPKRKSFKRFAIGSTVVVAVSSVAAVVAGVVPASAASIVAQPDAQIAIFMVPATLLVLATMFEVVRFSRRGPMQAGAPARARKRSHWSPGHGES
ncbi:MAG: hypothetical protein KKF33_15420 [Alphaproteobacteria bacterium]|nr:hypothetical protein [Alphaproteobacteria bacterium]